MISQRGFHGARRSPLGVGFLALSLFIAALLGVVAPISYGHSLRFSTTSELVDPIGAIPFLVIALSLGVIWCLFRTSPADRLQLFILMFAFRAALALVSGFLWHPQDELILHDIGHGLACCGLDTWAGQVLAGEGYTTLIGFLYAIFGPNLLVAKFLNVVIGSAIPFLAYDIAWKVFRSEQTARRALLLVGFLPPLLAYSAFSLKETLATAFLLLTLWMLMVPRWKLSGRLGGALLAVLATYLLRGEWAVFPLIAIASYLLLSGEVSAVSALSASRRLVYLGAVAIVLMVPLKPLVDVAIGKAQERIFVGAYATTSTLQTSGGVTAGLLDTAQPLSPRNLVIQLARAPFSPSPADVLIEPSIQSALDSINALAFYLVVPLAVVGLLAHRRRRDVLIVAVVGAVMLGVVGLALTLGLNIARHSIPSFGVLVILASAGWAERRRYGWIIGGWALAAFAYTLLYVGLTT